MVKLDEKDLYQLLIAEMRYSIKRDNHLAPGGCVQHVMDYLPEMRKDWRAHTAEQLTSEIIQEMIFGGTKGPLEQEAEWEKLLVFLTDYIEKIPFGVDRYMDVLFRKPLHVADIDYYSVEMHNKLIENRNKA
jgi:hypothetical protein